MLDILSQNGIYLLKGSFPDGPLMGLSLTIAIAVIGLALTFPAAVLIALARTSNLSLVYWPATIFVYVVRGIPLLMLIFWSYFMLPVLLGFPIDAVTTLVAAVIMYQTAYLSEVIRGGIEALPKGQNEAARSLGMTYFAIQTRIILPQALYNVLPGMINQFTAIIKESSLGAIITVPEITYVAQQINNATVTKPFQIFALLALTYFSLCYSLSKFASFVETRVQRKRSGVTA